MTRAPSSARTVQWAPPCVLRLEERLGWGHPAEGCGVPSPRCRGLCREHAQQAGPCRAPARGVAAVPVLVTRQAWPTLLPGIPAPLAQPARPWGVGAGSAGGAGRRGRSGGAHPTSLASLFPGAIGGSSGAQVQARSVAEGPRSGLVPGPWAVGQGSGRCGPPLTRPRGRAGDELELIRPSLYRNVARQLNVSPHSETAVTSAFLAVAAQIFSAGLVHVRETASARSALSRPSLRGAPLSSPVPRDGRPSIGLSFSTRRPGSRAVEGRASWGRGSLKLLSVCCISLQVSHHPKPSGSPSLNHLAILWSPPADGLGRAGPGSGAGVTWGKVVSLYSVAAGLAVDCVRQAQPAVVPALVDCVTWGKVVSLYSVAAGLAVDCVRQAQPAVVPALVDCLGEFVHKTLASWLRRRGGWPQLPSHQVSDPAVASEAPCAYD
ncbi:bcl-2-related ovarian killer protein [Pteropus vampyrus]|uniref:Bcl-2-related ovarian killer protein n=1 Tax=Pteropus vampyrus TaxID=132908 RepID=A0A6P6BP30_PTEVA|nr:bcl-2-related ovarian killer protein [Pteropus vampyrus]